MPIGVEPDSGSGSEAGDIASFPTIAAMQAFDGSALVEGAWFFEEQTLSYWSKKTEADPGTSDGITIVRDAGNTYTLYRRNTPHRFWSQQPSFYIDGVAGSDTNTGISPASPLLTIGELVRRTYTSNQPRDYFEVWVVDDVTSGESFFSNSEFEVFADPVLVDGPAAITAVQNFSRTVPAGGTRQIVTAAVAWSDIRQVQTSGGLVGWAISGINPGVSAETKLFSGGSYADPGGAETVSLYQLPAFGVYVRGSGNQYAGFYNVRLGGLIVGFESPYFEQCLIAGGFGVNLVRCNSAYFYVCNVNVTLDVDMCAFFTTIWASVVTGGGQIILRNSTLWAYSDTTLSGSYLKLIEQSKLVIPSGGGSFEIRDGGQIDVIDPESSVDLDITGDVLYGTGPAAVAVNLLIETTNARATFANQAQLQALVGVGGLGNAWQYANGLGGSVAGTWAALPAAGSSIAANFVGIIPRA